MVNSWGISREESGSYRLQEYVNSTACTLGLVVRVAAQSMESPCCERPPPFNRPLELSYVATGTPENGGDREERRLGDPRLHRSNLHTTDSHRQSLL